jgi:hypothetical protein
MKQLLAHNQEEQEKRFDAKRCRATPYAVGRPRTHQGDE